MTSPSPDQLPALLAVLEPYADECVLIGGWVPYLYRQFGGTTWAGKLSRTTELDMVVRESVPPAERPLLKELLQGAGLRPRPGTTHCAIWERAADGVDVLELLTPHTGQIVGPETKRIEHQAGVGAIVLTDLELAIQFVAELRIPIGDRQVRVRVPTLGAYLATKAMTFAARIPLQGVDGKLQKRGKDLVYIHDVMLAGEELRVAIGTDLAAIAKAGRPHAEHLRKARNHLSLLRGSSPHPALSDAVALIVERDVVSPELARAAIRGAAEDLVEMLDEASGP